VVWNYRFKFHKRGQQFNGAHKDFEVRKDQEFPLATAEGNRTYKLIDVRPDKAVIVDPQNPGAPIEIGFANP
jgi:hypothetical protein